MKLLFDIKGLECNHTLSLVGDDGERLGSWVDEAVDEQIRVVCARCRKFYAYYVAETMPVVLRTELDDSLLPR